MSDGGVRNTSGTMPPVAGDENAGGCCAKVTRAFSTSGAVGRLYPCCWRTLCPTTVARSTPSALTSTGTLPRLCAASVCSSSVGDARPSAPRPGLAARTAATIAASGCTAPTSLLLCMMVTSTVDGRSAAATSAGDTMPCPSTGTAVYSSRPWGGGRAGGRSSVSAASERPGRVCRRGKGHICAHPPCTCTHTNTPNHMHAPSPPGRPGTLTPPGAPPPTSPRAVQSRLAGRQWCAPHARPLPLLLLPLPLLLQGWQSACAPP